MSRKDHYAPTGSSDQTANDNKGTPAARETLPLHDKGEEPQPSVPLRPEPGNKKYREV
jgi:hypothetical protein